MRQVLLCHPTHEQQRLSRSPVVQLEVIPGLLEYRASTAADTIWHLNFADSDLFGYYAGTSLCAISLQTAHAAELESLQHAGPLFAQDEVQVCEHPALASVKEALLKGRQGHLQPATEDSAGHSTPILIQGVDRCLAIDTSTIYGNSFARASQAQVPACAKQLRPPQPTNILAMAAPACRSGHYSEADVVDVLTTAVCGFAAACHKSGSCTATIATGHWGCGAFGGSRVMMAALQLAAARLAGVHKLLYYAYDDRGAADVHLGRELLDRCWELGRPCKELVVRLAEARVLFGQSDGT